MNLALVLKSSCFIKDFNFLYKIFIFTIKPYFTMCIQFAKILGLLISKYSTACMQALYNGLIQIVCSLLDKNGEVSLTPRDIHHPCKFISFSS